MSSRLEEAEPWVAPPTLSFIFSSCSSFSDLLLWLPLQGMRVVNIVGFRRGYNFLNELLGLAKPFGKVVKHLVLDLRAEVLCPLRPPEAPPALPAGVV